MPKSSTKYTFMLGKISVPYINFKLFKKKREAQNPNCTFKLTKVITPKSEIRCDCSLLFDIEEQYSKAKILIESEMTIKIKDQKINKFAEDEELLIGIITPLLSKLILIYGELTDNSSPLPHILTITPQNVVQAYIQANTKDKKEDI